MTELEALRWVEAKAREGVRIRLEPSSDGAWFAMVVSAEVVVESVRKKRLLDAIYGLRLIVEPKWIDKI
jgi:DNA-binding FadR family transcriptional regulator